MRRHPLSSQIVSAISANTTALELSLYRVQIEHFNDKLSVLTQIEDTCTRSSLVAERLLSAKVVGEHQPPTASGIADADQDGIFQLLQTQLRSLVDAAKAFAAELTLRQAKWLALSSQLKACPLGKFPSADLQSWLSQVREGKISGAGHDASYSTAAEQLAYVTPTHMVDSSNLFLESSESTATADRRPSCLATAREDLTATHSYLSGACWFCLSDASVACRF